MESKGTSSSAIEKFHKNQSKKETTKNTFTQIKRKNEYHLATLDIQSAKLESKMSRND